MSSDIAVKEINGGLAIPKGTRAVPISHQYLDQDGNPVDLTSGTWTGQGRAEQLHETTQPPNIGDGSVGINIPTATATYEWVDEDFETIGRFRLIIWIGNGTQRFGSTVYEWNVADAPGADPTV